MSGTSGEFVAVDDGLQERPHVGAGSAETLMEQVRGDTRLSEVLGIGGAEGFVGIGVTGFAVAFVAHDLYGGVVDHVTVAAGIIGAGRDGSEKAVTLVAEALEH